MKKYMAAAVLISYIVLAAGCTGSASSQSESSLQTDSSTAEVTTSAAPTEQPEEVSETEAVPELAETTAAQTEATQDTSAPEEQGGYIADWIYGTWSAVSVNGQDYWDYAFANGLTEQLQLIFNSEEVLVRNGTVGIEQEYSYAITDAGADIYYSWGEKSLTLTYDPSADTLTMIDEADNFAVFKRGEYPQSAEVDYIADWIYGTWSVISVNGQDYWEYAAQNDEDQEKMMIFTAQGVDITSGDRVLRTLNYRITDEGAEIRDTDGAVILMTYSPQDDTLTFTADGYTTVVKRGTNPKPAEN